MDFNLKEKNLCNQIAERNKKMIVYGSWYIGKNKDIRIWDYKYAANPKDLIPLWTISDCLKFLINRGYQRVDILALEGRFVLWLVHGDTNKCYEPDGDTILEAFLRAVLTVLDRK